MKVTHKRALGALIGILTAALALTTALTALAARPDTVTVDVYQNYVYYDTYTLRESDGWRIDIPLPKYDEFMNAYNYTVVEHPVAGFTSTVYSQVDTGFDDYYYFVVNQDAGVVTVTFDYNYTGAPANTALTTSLGNSLGADMPPNPIRSGYIFLGWNTQPDGGGSAFTASTAVNSDITVWAQWQYDGGGPVVTPTPPAPPISPESPVPPTEIPGGENPIDIGDEDIPLVEGPGNEEIIEQPPPPLTEAPKTGDGGTVLYGLLLLGAGSATTILCGIRRYKRHEEE